MRTLVTLAVSGLAVLAGMWWLYFVVESERELNGIPRRPSCGATATTRSSPRRRPFPAASRSRSPPSPGPAHAAGLPTRLALALPLAVFVLVVWALVLRSAVSRGADAVVLAGAAAMFAAGFLPVADATSTAVEAVLVAAVVAGVVGLGGTVVQPVAAEPA